MYDELVKRLAKAAISADSGNEISESLYRDIMQAADAIEELSADCDMYRKGMTDEHNRAAKLAWDKEHCWIPVTERLPEIGQRILAVGRRGKAMYTATYSGGQKMENRKANPYKIITGEHGWRTFTYWMPLPEPPKEG